MQDTSLVCVGQGVGDLGAQPGDFAIVTIIALTGEGAGRSLRSGMLAILGVPQLRRRL